MAAHAILRSPVHHPAQEFSQEFCRTISMHTRFSPKESTWERFRISFWGGQKRVYGDGKELSVDSSGGGLWVEVDQRLKMCKVRSRAGGQGMKKEGGDGWWRRKAAPKRATFFVREP
ncbi:hypothetical protein ACJRO7_027748 [Eucalyptus globulus]|uniref:Uncharacterized protein n=1 Tax=Eucalyptus globulus TaxID=34317 RepID=A0ABD3JT05_EUCGL